MYTLTCTQTWGDARHDKCSPEWSDLYMFPMDFPVQYFQYPTSCWPPLWQVTDQLGLDDGKKEGSKAAEAHQYQKKVIRGSWEWLWVWIMRENGEEAPSWESKVVAAVLLVYPGDSLWKEGKNMGLKSWMSVQKMKQTREKTLHHEGLTPVVLLAPSSRIPSHYGAHKHGALPYPPFTVHTLHSSWWLLRLFLPEPLQVKLDEWMSKEGAELDSLCTSVGQLRYISCNKVTSEKSHSRKHKQRT